MGVVALPTTREVSRTAQLGDRLRRGPLHAAILLICGYVMIKRGRTLQIRCTILSIVASQNTTRKSRSSTQWYVPPMRLAAAPRPRSSGSATATTWMPGIFWKQTSSPWP